MFVLFAQKAGHLQVIHFFFALVDAFENTQITKIASSNGIAGEKKAIFCFRIFYTISIAVIFHTLFAQLALHTRNFTRNVEKRL